MSVDPSAFGGDITAALTAAEEFLLDNFTSMEGRRRRRREKSKSTTTVMGKNDDDDDDDDDDENGSTHRSEVGAVVIGNPSPATGVVSPLGDALKVMQFCRARGAHLVSDETLSPGVFVRSSSSAAAAAGAGAGDGPINRRLAAKKEEEDDVDEEEESTYLLLKKKKKTTTTTTTRAFGRQAGFISTSSLWRKAESRAHVVTAFGAAAGLPRGKTSCLLITQDDDVRRLSGSDPYANGLQALFCDGGTAAREAFGHHNKLLRGRQKMVRSALRTLGVAKGPVERQKKAVPPPGGRKAEEEEEEEEERPAVACSPSDGGAVAWLDLREWCGESWADEARLWDQLASIHRVLLVPGGLCGASEPGWFRLCVAGTGEALEEGLQRLELGLRYANDTGTG